MEEQHEAATADLERMREEHSSLTHMNSILEALLAVRDTAVSVLQGAKVRGPAAWVGSPSLHVDVCCGGLCAIRMQVGVLQLSSYVGHCVGTDWSLSTSCNFFWGALLPQFAIYLLQAPDTTALALGAGS